MTKGPERSPDDDLQRSVSDALFVDPNVSVGAAIDVTVEDGEVTLRGTVGSFGEKREARSAAQRVPGIRSVKDELEVSGPTDAELRTAVLEALRLDGLIPATIAAEAHEGLVTLTGSVEAQHQHDAAAFIARNVPGVSDVANQIGVRDRPWSAGGVEDADSKSVGRIAKLEAEGEAAKGDRSHREIEARLAAAAQRIERLRSGSEAGGNVVRFRLARYVESLEADAIDANGRLGALEDDRSYEAEVLERDVSALEVNVAVAEAKLDAALAEEHDDPHGEIQAEIRAIDVEADALKRRLGQPFDKGR